MNTQHTSETGMTERKLRMAQWVEALQEAIDIERKDVFSSLLLSANKGAVVTTSTHEKLMRVEARWRISQTIDSRRERGNVPMEIVLEQLVEEFEQDLLSFRAASTSTSLVETAVEAVLLEVKSDFVRSKGYRW